MINNIIFLDSKKMFQHHMTKQQEWVTIHFSKEEHMKNEISFDIYEKLKNIL